MHITEKTKEYECCCSCKHNIRKSDEKGIYCECEIDGHYIGHIECFDSVCERWKKNNMDYETLRNSMTVQDAARVLKETNCYGTMDIAKNVILKALEAQPNEDCISRKAVLDALHRYFAEGFNGDKWWNSTYVLDAINKVPSVTPQPNTEHIIKSTIKEYIDKECDDVTELLLALNKDLCERIRKEN